MKISLQGRFKSLTSFEWDNIPQFVVITGPNGSGKTQLIELIYESITYQKTTNKEPTWRLSITGENYAFNEVVYLSGRMGGS
ncbi:hypothetical protein [Pedobacter sp. MC2016-24]|uniref:hypothetical protein n=1 Tax=Pedobacter sp. MC2016-24 TaxID=2780090 RepID=UPI00187F2CF1|nr:hypothetical protein [Pedobacter sp. MC2016-24]MBE9597754.1 hypothetical protein [Pedobacter sp. MC2016-24]